PSAAAAARPRRVAVAGTRRALPAAVAWPPPAPGVGRAVTSWAGAAAARAAPVRRPARDRAATASARPAAPPPERAALRLAVRPAPVERAAARSWTPARRRRPAGRPTPTPPVPPA